MLREIRQAIADHWRADRTASDLADKVVASIRALFGGERHYISAPSNELREEGERLLGMGHAPDEIAKRLKVHPATVYRWRKTARRRADPKPESTGLAKDRDWLL